MNAAPRARKAASAEAEIAVPLRAGALAAPVWLMPRTSVATTARNHPSPRCRQRRKPSVSSCPPGYHLELVLSDPDIISPAAMAFDGNGRLYLTEFRSWMLDADAGHQHEPTSRISMHESTRRDGKFDRHTVFADNLLAPRMVLPLDKGILTNETHSDDVLLLTDTDGDGVADKRQVFYTGVGNGRSGNMQQAQSGFVWALDNWIYSTYNAFRFRWTPRGILREPSGPPGAEWGMSMDDDGKIWLVNAGGERGPANFQIPIQYGAFMVNDQWEQDYEIPWPAPGIGDMQGGLPRVRMPANNLSHFTSTTGPEIVRTDEYPADMNGDLLFADPVGRFVRRSKIVKTEGLTQVRNAYPDRSSSRAPTRCSAQSTSSRVRTARSTSSTCTTASSRMRPGPAAARTFATRSSSTGSTR